MTADIERKSTIVSSVLTAILFALFVVLCFTLKFEKKPVYKTIQIQLSSAPSAQSQKASPAKESVPVQEEAPAVPKSAPEPIVSEKPAGQKSAPAKQAPENSVPKATSTPAKSQSAQKTENAQPNGQTFWQMKKSVEELQQEQAAQKKSTNYDDSIFDNAETATSSASGTKSSASSSSSGFSGSAGSASSTTADTPTTSTQSGNRVAQNTLTTGTQSKLAQVVNATYSSTVADGVKSKTNVKASSSNGKTSLVMNDGKARELLQPSKPVIALAEELVVGIDSSRTVRITFQVLSSGRVPVGGISFSPASLLSMPIQDEIRSQISTWLFSEDPTGANAIGSFEYTIEVR